MKNRDSECCGDGCYWTELTVNMKNLGLVREIVFTVRPSDSGSGRRGELVDLGHLKIKNNEPVRPCDSPRADEASLAIQSTIDEIIEAHVDREAALLWVKQTGRAYRSGPGRPNRFETATFLQRLNAEVCCQSRLDRCHRFGCPLDSYGHAVTRDRASAASWSQRIQFLHLGLSRAI